MSKALITGTFDILHPGHIAILRFAGMFERVLLLVDTDERVAELKGPGRPINNLETRTHMLYALKGIEYPHFDVKQFGSDAELSKEIRTFRPEYWIMGSDHTRADVPVEVPDRLKFIFFDRLPGHSSTRIIEASREVRH